ncbi:MAG: hypothetical protein LBR82_02125 [Desulfovibrio sp.]|jgi:hypothetical protein|nr:hypothetical protein [Desulfovibrio sp.]
MLGIFLTGPVIRIAGIELPDRGGSGSRRGSGEGTTGNGAQVPLDRFTRSGIGGPALSDAEASYASAGRTARRGVSPAGKIGEEDASGRVGGSAEAAAGDVAEQTHGGGASAETGREDTRSADRASGPAGVAELTPEEEQTVRELKARDREVRAHEQAHAAVGGGFAGAPSYEMQTGPDGKRYAVGGEVPIDVSPAATPEATIAKARRIRAAASAPAQPSGADRGIAARASAMEAEALREKAAEDRETSEAGTSGAWGGNAGVSAFKVTQTYARVAEFTAQLFPDTGRILSLAV